MGIWFSFFSNSHSRHVWCRRCFWPRGVVRSLVAAPIFSSLSHFRARLSAFLFGFSVCTCGRRTTSLHFSVNAFFARATALAFLFFDFRAAQTARDANARKPAARETFCSRQDQLLLIAFLYFTLEFHPRQRIFQVRPKLTNSVLDF